MIFSPNVSRVDGGVHGHQAIVIGSLCITTVDHGARRRKGLHNAICSANRDTGICACADGTLSSSKAAHTTATCPFLNCGSGSEKRVSLSLSFLIIISVSFVELSSPTSSPSVSYREYFCKLFFTDLPLVCA